MDLLSPPKSLRRPFGGDSVVLRNDTNQGERVKTMRAGLRIMVVPSESGGVHIRVTPMHMPEGKASASMPDVISTVVDKSPNVASPSDLRLWVNAVTRLVARTLEDDLYESWKDHLRESTVPFDGA